MEGTYWTLCHGIYLMELTPWKLPHERHTMEGTYWNVHHEIYLMELTPLKLPTGIFPL